ncbi:MAG: hypothetical protein GF310_02405 [candidate division Zixibacteria bacterium]|nr:hypothetical protein [candidate division Zixibacteria bacterium]
MVIAKDIFYILIISFLTLGISACLNPFAPSVLGPSGVKAIVRQVEPDSTLHNFKYAYEHNDIDVYENCLDENFIFRYVDQDLTGQIETVEVPRDGASGDIERTRNLFAFFDEIQLDPWIPVFDRTEIKGDEIWEVYKVYFQLSVRDTDGDFGLEHYEATGIAEFSFRQSDKDDLWRIVFWDDQSNQ